MQAWYFVLEGARRFFLGKGHLYEEFVNYYWDFWKGTKAKTLREVSGLAMNK